MLVSSCFGERHGRDAMNSVFLRCLFCIFEKEKNKKPSLAAPYYDDMFTKFQEIWYEAVTKKRYDKEFVTLFREIGHITTDYYLSVYNELGTEQSKKSLEAKSRILDNSAILKFVTDNPNYYK